MRDGYVAKEFSCCQNRAMNIGAFEISEPLPELKEPHAIAMLRPWVDVGRVGTVVLGRLEQHFTAKELGRLAQPGWFFDFTRYRPTLSYVEGARQVTVPNTIIYYAQRGEEPDFIFLQLLEPHASSEEYIDSVLDLLKSLGTKRYLQLGGMYDVVPHTRPLLVTGTLRMEGGEEIAQQFQIRKSTYEGPTSIMYMVSYKAHQMGLETTNLMVHLPQYLQLEEDYSGASAILETLRAIYHLPQELTDAESGVKQYRELSAIVARNLELRVLVERLESMYDARVASGEGEVEEGPPLSKEVEKFLIDIDKRFGKN